MGRGNSGGSGRWAGNRGVGGDREPVGFRIAAGTVTCWSPPASGPAGQNYYNNYNNSASRQVPRPAGPRRLLARRRRRPPRRRPRPHRLPAAGPGPVTRVRWPASRRRRALPRDPPPPLPAGARVSQGPVTTVVEYDRASSSLYINARRRHCQWYKHSQWISTNDFFNRFDSR